MGWRGGGALAMTLAAVALGGDLPPLEVKDPIGHVKARVASADGAIPAGAELLARNEGDHAPHGNRAGETGD